MRKMKTIDLVYAGMFAALMAVGANIAQFLVVGGIPITLQTFFAILAGLLLGSRLGAISMTVYVLVGFAGAPVFAQFTGGPGVLFKPTFGFILSYILVAYIAGKIVESKANPTVQTFMIASFSGFILNYVLGTNFMYFAYKFWAMAPEGFTYSMAWMWMLAPLPKDIILSIVAAVISPRIYKAVNKNTQRPHRKAA